ncbi:hypothetical protein BDA99DRAFT_533780 [Phascolomyces articulosus]|uniref:Uncharacterized protein n=1 Tax=Phascolomyces articulosus TaxID=60185 RepID=A0AAD5KPM3_9FUNG|nr:hypothetical protein BDA99DRAFT_533780 [Phascolomyces articulosus]
MSRKEILQGDVLFRSKDEEGEGLLNIMLLMMIYLRMVHRIIIKYTFLYDIFDMVIVDVNKNECCCFNGLIVADDNDDDNVDIFGVLLSGPNLFDDIDVPAAVNAGDELHNEEEFDKGEYNKDDDDDDVDERDGDDVVVFVATGRTCCSRIEDGCVIVVVLCMCNDGSACA